MGRIFGILMVVVLIWGGLEVFTKGTDGAFGGALAGWFAPLPTPELAEDGVPIHRAVGERVQADLDRAYERREAALD